MHARIKREREKKRNSIMFVHGLHTYCIAGHVEKENMKRWAKREERKKKYENWRMVVVAMCRM